MTDNAWVHTSAVRVDPLGRTLGARVHGVERAGSWDAPTRAAIRQAFLDHHVLIFPGGLMSAEETLAFARRFGEAVPELNREKRDTDLPEVSRIDSTIEARGAGGSPAFRVRSVARAQDWHTDQSFLEKPARATVLHAHEVPERGGATWFCNTAAAYDALPESLERRVEGRHAVHRYDSRRARRRPVMRSQEEIDETPDVVHPLVRTHPESGRRALYLNSNRLERIVGLDRADSDDLLDALTSWATQDRFVYRHRWTAGDAVVWDNRCTMHRVCYDSEPGARRIMLRVVTRGERPV